MDPEVVYARAMTALQSGQVAEARRLLVQVIQVKPRHEQAWLSLASVLTNSDQKLDCLKRVLAINPENSQAISLLDQAKKEKVRQEVLDLLTGPAPTVEKGSVSRLGEYLLRAQTITSRQLEFALAEQQKTVSVEQPKRLGEILVELGFITEQQLDQAVLDQFRDFNNLFVD